MRIKFSEDYKGPGFGFLTKAKEYDKWAHLAGSATGVLFAVLVGIPLFWSIVQIAVLGIGLEIWQGRKRWLWEYREDERYARLGSRAVPLSYDKADGFSWLDLVANALGILLAWGVLR